MRENRPIKSSIKGKRLLQRESIDATSWAYMKQLRENNKTKRIYDVNPYAEVYQFRDNMYGILTISADGMGDPWMFLIVGPEKAMLIDTGFGIGDLKGLVDEITGDMPLIVANTHCHFDHAYGNCQFERCYCHEYETAAMATKQDPTIWDYLFDEDDNGIWMEFDRADVIAFKEYEVVGVPDGYIFDLGDGYVVELIWTPGHAAGHAMFLDRTNRNLIAGDGIISMRVGMGRGSQYTTISAYRKEMIKLCQRLDEFDHIFPGHFVVDLENTVIPSIVETCDAIIADLLDYGRNRSLDLEDTDVDSWLEVLLKEHEIPAQITLNRQLAAGVKLPLDRERFRRCMINVINNACHAMQPGGGPLRVTSGVEDHRLVIRVIDAGCGIPPEQLKDVFEPLFSTKNFGAGLGLSIVKQIVHQHGGKIELQSQPGHGTTVIVHLPLQQEREASHE